MIRCMLAVLAVVVVMAGTAAAQGDKQWEAVAEVPASEQLPAAPLLVTAYAIVWLVPMGYLWAIWRRLDSVEREIKDLERRGAAGSPRP